MPDQESLQVNLFRDAVQSAVGDGCRALCFGDSTSAPANSPRWGQGHLLRFPYTWRGWMGPAQSQAPDEGHATFNDGTAIAAGALLNDGVTTNPGPVPLNETVKVDPARFSGIQRHQLTNLQNYLGGTPFWWETADLRLKWHMVYTGETEPTYRLRCKRDTGGNAVQNGAAVPGGLAAGDHFALDQTFSNDGGSSDTMVEGALEGDATRTGTFTTQTFGPEFYDNAQEAGFHYCALASGGWSITDHLDTVVDSEPDGKYSDAALTWWYQNAYPFNTAIVCLGFNDGADHDAFQTNLGKLVDRIRRIWTAVGESNGHILLLTQWRTSTGDTKAQNQAARAAAVLAAKGGSISMISVDTLANRAHGEADTWNPLYTSDQVHQNAAGADEFARLLWEEVQNWTPPPVGSYPGRGTTGRVGCGIPGLGL